jgi:hypothetical protein
MQQSECPWAHRIVGHGYETPKILFSNGDICDVREFIKPATMAQLRELHKLGLARCMGGQRYVLEMTKKAFTDLVADEMNRR